jgi:hypothetical protein
VAIIAPRQWRPDKTSRSISASRSAATLLLAIATINVWNRLKAAVRQPVGAWKV